MSDSHRRHRLTIDFGGTRIKTALFTRGAPHGPAGGWSLTDAWSAPNRDSPGDLDAIAERYRGTGDLDGVGVAVPGIVDAAAGRLIGVHGKYAHLAGRDLRAWATGFGVPRERTVIENDARAALAGEVADGVARGAHDAVLVILGTGIGTAVLLGGRLLRGRSGHAGVLGGHQTVELSGPECNCGNVGCAEALGGTWALGPRARTHPGYQGSELARLAAPGVRDLLRLAAQDEVAAWVLRSARDAWTATVVSMCHAFDPEVVVLAGGPVSAGAAVLDPLRADVDQRLWSTLARPRIVAADRPEESVLRGLRALLDRPGTLTRRVKMRRSGPPP